MRDLILFLRLLDDYFVQYIPVTRVRVGVGLIEPTFEYLVHLPLILCTWLSPMLYRY
jgi:hypothetical protein